MGDPVTINLRHVARGLGLPLGQVQAVLELLDEANTVPFITRYRKDRTGGLDEEQIRQIQARLAKLRLLAERKQTILRSIESQGKLTEKLSKQIRNAGTAKRLEDLYLPYKPKKLTLATSARSRGLEPLANEILAAETGCADLDSRARDFVNPDRQVPTPADALLGAGHIIAEQFSERAELRQRLREILHRTGSIVSARAGGDSKAAAEKPEKGKGRGPVSTDPASATAEPPPRPAVPDAAQPSEEAPQPAPEQAGSSPAEPAAVEPSPQSAQPPATGEPVPIEQPLETGARGDGPDEAHTEGEPPVPAPGEIGQPAPTPLPAAPVPGSEAEVKAPPEQPAEPLPGPPPVAEAEPPLRPAPELHPKPAKAERRLTKKELKKKRAEEKRQKAFADYFDYREQIRKIPPHRVLAINRGERARVLRVKIECDVEAMHRALDEACVPHEHPHAEFLRGCARDALARLILPSLERETRRELTERAETHAVGVFARNLRNLLLQPPVRGRRVLAVDPGYRSGCKLAALDQFGNLLAQDVIYLVGRPERKAEAKRIVTDLIHRFQLTVVTIGNGTACREAEDFFADLLAGELKDRDLAYVIVNEAGASVYSTSRIGREEFPNYDASLRGAISIGRRLQDPLSELVKIDPANIGVGLYQHDVKAKHLRTSLDEVVESCVNYVGVDANTASPALLGYVSGLNQLTARRVYEHRRENGPFRSREQLREVPGFGEATFVQAAGFLKISGGDNPLDTTWIHPESYEAAGRVMAKLGCSPADLTRKEATESLKAQIRQLDVPALAKELDVGELLLKDILAQLARPGRDPREDLPTPVFKKGVLKLEDLHPGMELTGTVLNVVDFGAFVDIGMHDSGLVHVSQLADRYVRDPHDVIAVGDIVKVWVVEVDKERRRVSLTMIPPRPRRPAGRRDDRPAQRRRDERPERPARGERSRSEARPRGKGPPRGRGRGPSKPRYRPKSRPKPITPITDEMKAGREPMRSFSDLAQFFGPEKPKPAKPADKAKPPRATDKPQAVQDEPQTDKDKPQAIQEEPQTDKDKPQAVQDEPQTEKEKPLGDQAEARSAQQDPQAPKPDDQQTDRGQTADQDPTARAEAPPSQHVPESEPSAEQEGQQEPKVQSDQDQTPQNPPEATQHDEKSTGPEGGAAVDRPEKAQDSQPPGNDGPESTPP